MEIILVTCPQYSTVLRLVSGELPDEAVREFQAHMGSCIACREAYARAKETWDALGVWQTDAPVMDIRERVARALDEAPDRLASGTGALRPWRAAASLFLAVGLGAAAGMLVPIQRDRNVAAPTVDQVSDSLGLVFLADNWGMDLASNLDANASSDSQGARP